MDAKELEKIIKLAKKSGIKHLKVDGVEINFDESVFEPKIKKDMSPEDKIDVEGAMSEEDALFWSVGGISETPKSTN